MKETCKSAMKVNGDGSVTTVGAPMMLMLFADKLDTPAQVSFSSIFFPLHEIDINNHSLLIIMLVDKKIIVNLTIIMQMLFTDVIPIMAMAMLPPFILIMSIAMGMNKN